MPVLCARCGAPNPDGNAYCQSCGSPLAAPVPAEVATAVAPPSAIPGPPPGPPPGFPAPVMGPGGFQSPYYTPTGPVPPVHRTPWTLIIAGVVALVLVMAGAGTALALLGSHKNSPPSTTTSGGLGSALSSPSPGVTPSPVASPVTTSATTQSNDGVTVTLPAGWSVVSSNSETIVLSDPDGGGSVLLASGTSSPPQTALDNKSQIDDYFKNNYPDAQSCPNTTTANTTFNGVTGISWVLCFTVTAGGHSVPGTASLFVGANSSGTVYYLVMVVTQQGNLASYLNVVKPVLQSVQWKLG